MPENISSAYFNQLVEQLAEERLKGLQLYNIGDAEGTYTCLDFVVWTHECGEDFIKQLCTIDTDL